MGFILVSLVVGVMMVLLSKGIGRLENAKILKIVACMMSACILAFFISTLFASEDKIYNTIVIVVSLVVLVIFPISFYPDESKCFKRFLSSTACIIVIVGCVAGIWCGSGYQEDVKEIEAIQLDECNFIYGENQYSFYVYEETNNYVYLKHNSATNKFEEIKISKSEAKVEEDVNCAEPRLVVYERKAKQTFWSFGVAKKTEYVFYLPTNAVSEDILP